MQQESRYKLIWDKLKTDRLCEVVAEPKFHKRIIKAVSKRKDLDLAHKLLCSEAGYKDKLLVSIELSKITFLLQKFKPLTIEDL